VRQRFVEEGLESALSPRPRTSIPKKLDGEVAAWENHRNTLACRCNWQFTTEEARIKLTRLYPVIDALLDLTYT